MAVQKIDYSLNPPWTYNELIQKYYEILGTLGVYGPLVDTLRTSTEKLHRLCI